jgi:hypothetical protein
MNESEKFESTRLVLVTLLNALEHASITTSYMMDVLTEDPKFKAAYEKRVELARQSSDKSLASGDTNTVGHASIELATALARLLVKET